MNGSIPIPYKLGESLWAVGPSTRKETVPCPECLGTKVLTVTQGNGSQFTVQCECCTPGYGPAQGVIEQTRIERHPIPFTPHRVAVNGNEVTYSQADPDATCYAYKCAEDLFVDHAVCAARCREMDKRDHLYREKQAVANLGAKRKKLAFSVHYWQGQVERLERDLGLARARLGLCQERESQKRANTEESVLSG